MVTAKILSAQSLGIDDALISKNALKVVETIQQAGYECYLVGGCARDLLLNIKPKDFDVATNATPEQVKKLFKNGRIIGRRFKIVHVRFGYEVIEVATFRANAEDREGVRSNEMSQSEEGHLTRDNVYGSIEEDVVRRDFTANALYYDPIKGEIYDYMNGLADIENKFLRSIGEPEHRFREDPVRMLRVIRFAAKLGFEMQPEARKMIEEDGSLLSHVPPARLFEEVLKLFHGGSAYDTYKMLSKYGMLKYLFPFTDQSAIDGVEGMPELALQNTDKRVRAGKPVIPAFLFACMMWDPVRDDAQQLMAEGTPEAQAWRIAMNDGLRDQNQYVAVPRRLAEIIMDIWNIQFRLVKRNPRMVKACMGNRRFRAAYDFLLLRSRLHEVDEELAQWWTDIQEEDDEGRKEMIDQASETYKSERNHSGGEANGNSVNYNSKAELDHSGNQQNTRQSNRQNKSGGRNNRQGGQSRSNANGQKPSGRGGRSRRSATGATGNGGRGRSRGENPNGQRSKTGGTNSPFRTRRGNPNNRPNHQSHQQPSHHSNDMPTVDDYNVGQPSTEKKVKIRHKRRVVKPVIGG